ncbi:MAG: STAS domain-containing protein [Gemmatimonadota bacterium]
MTTPAETLTVEPGSTSADGTVVLLVAGDLVVSNMSLLERTVDEALDAGGLRIVLDVSALEHIDAPGLALLCRLDSRCEATGGALAVAALPDRFLELIRKLQLDQQVRFVRSVEEAEKRPAR